MGNISILKKPKLKKIYSNIHYLGNDLCLVSDNEQHKPIENVIKKMAKYFQKEGRFDFLAYDSKYQTYLLANNHLFEYEVYGALQVETEIQGKYSNLTWAKSELSWIWIHPDERNRGVGTAVVKALNQIYEDLTLSFPWSKAMRKIAIKTGIVNKYSEFKADSRMI